VGSAQKSAFQPFGACTGCAHSSHSPWSVPLVARPVPLDRPPLALTLALPVIASLPAAAHAGGAAEYHGSLVDSAAGTRYVAYDAAGATLFTSPLGAIDGALGAVTPGGTDAVVYTAAAARACRRAACTSTP